MNGRVFVLANSSGGLYGFRKEFLAVLLECNEVWASVPNNGNFEDLKQLSCQLIETPINRRGVNPVTDFKLFARYMKMLRQHKPDLVITYTIKPNVYGGLACRMGGHPLCREHHRLGNGVENSSAMIIHA